MEFNMFDMTLLVQVTYPSCEGHIAADIENHVTLPQTDFVKAKQLMVSEKCLQDEATTHSV